MTIKEIMKKLEARIDNDVDALMVRGKGTSGSGVFGAMYVSV